MSDDRGSRQSVINVNMPTIETLYLSYMPFLEGGGIFVKTNRTFGIGDEVFLLVTFLEETARIGVTGKVAWINAKSSAGRPIGVGIQFTGNEGAQLQKKIEAHLAGILEGDRPTYTL